jgi:PAS domain S-box-containing protein
VNQRWLDYTGLTLKEAQGDGWADVLSPDDREQTLRIWRDALSEGTLYETEERLRGADGKQRWFLARALPLRDPQGCITKWYGTNTDIEDRKHAEEVVRQLQMELAQVGRVTAMGAMAASIAHEVNQPLGAIVGNADICLRWLVSATPDLGKVRDALGDIIADGHRASEVVARIRSLFKNEASQKTSFGINEVVREALALVNHETQRRRVVLRAELASDVPLVRGDRVQLRQVVLNLIINGIEAMSGIEEGKRELVIRSGRDERYGVRITVQDCGVGIDPREAQRLFTAFYTTKPGGMGMGLAICRLIVEAHGGRLWVVPHSRPGATFQFALPASGEEER